MKYKLGKTKWENERDYWENERDYGLYVDVTNHVAYSHFERELLAMGATPIEDEEKGEIEELDENEGVWGEIYLVRKINKLVKAVNKLREERDGR